MCTLVYFGSGEDFTPLILGIYNGDGTYHKRQEYKQSEHYNPHFINILDNVDTYIYIDVTPYMNESLSNMCNLYQTEEHFFKYMDVRMRWLFGSDITHHHDTDNKILTWKIANNTLHYIYSTDYKNAYSITPDITALIKNADILYEHGFYPEDYVGDPFIQYTPNVNTVIHHHWHYSDIEMDTWKKSLLKYIVLKYNSKMYTQLNGFRFNCVY